jgi:hypothetical protein
VNAALIGLGGLIVGAAAKWFFDWLTHRRSESLARQNEIREARLDLVAQADRLFFGLARSTKESADKHPDKSEIDPLLVAATEAATRLIALGDVQGATRAIDLAHAHCVQGPR